MTADNNEHVYSPRFLDKKWQDRWTKDGLHSVDDNDPRPKWYELTMFPYPSGDLHIGHWYAMAPSDAHARFRKMQGYNVLHPMGFDAFGLPAENAAIKRGIHPYEWTMSNIENMRGQLKSMGTIYDWDREIICALPEYYRWNQWFFLQFYKAGLAYRAHAPANWCPSCQTVLANEQVIDGNCERCDTEVSRRDLEQWFLRITKYAEELLDFSGLLDWPERIKAMQSNWIGRSEGTHISFDISHCGLEEVELRTFTTRIDTIYGVTFVVLAPEHPLVDKLTAPEKAKEVKAYVEQARRQTEIERLSADKEKTGVFIGSYCVNRLNGEKVPIFIADYALLSYGTGIVMGVPAHDTRDFAFAQKFDLPVKVVIAPDNWNGNELEEAHIENGTQVNSGQFDGLTSDHGKDAIADYIEGQGWGERTVSYRIRDWLISRQRYWGTPIPIIYCDRCGIVPVSEDMLPVLLPEDAQFRPTGESPLRYNEGFLNTSCPACGGMAKRETDTMDTFVDSSWYHMRYTSPSYHDAPIDPKTMAKWLPVDQYTGGAEHAVMHLLYSRFFNKAIRDIGLVDYDEPYLRLFNQGTIISQNAKMSKSRGNVINPDIYVDKLGADVVRGYIMFLGPWDQGGEWSDGGINGMARWFNRLWDIVTRDVETIMETPNPEKAERDLTRLLHKTIRRVEEDYSRFKFNTALAAMMELTNYMARAWDNNQVTKSSWTSTISNLLILLAPIAPHVTEELWERMGNEYSIHNQLMPDWDKDLAQDEEITLVVQVNGKVRDKIQVEASVSEDQAKSIATESEKIKPYLQGMDIRQLIYVPGKLVNIVVS
ncbi:MAG: leucine--tRNA ligase [SAR202 cluster bacterium]|nr:leucine--tRNA ligase [SAR202 cluster bacterium]|tara:strand:+ start:632 stop:3100 length:2469 start_codon:yes stop_codon:yes gene_type:complete